MHELSIATRIMEIVKEVMKEHSAKSVGEITVEVGSLSCIDPSSLEFCFEAIIRDSPLEGARLRIDRKQAMARCRSCGKTYEVCDMDFSCGNCGSHDFEITSGTDILITQVEVE